tara:strand:+ start:6076 stop:6336 length:261 start_codon:yes stop_codon:yes gene_type:complete
MKKKLSTGKEITLKEISIDDMDSCNDLQHICQESDGGISIYGLNKSNTAWVRKGVEGSDDKFIKSLTEAEKIELVALVKEHNTLGE